MNLPHMQSEVQAAVAVFMPTALSAAALQLPFPNFPFGDVFAFSLMRILLLWPGLLLVVVDAPLAQWVIRHGAPPKSPTLPCAYLTTSL